MKLRHSSIARTVVLVFGSAIAANAQTSWKTYRDPAYGFSIRYPSSMTYYSGHPDWQATQLSMVPLCDVSTVACFEYNRSDVKGTNLQAAGLSVNVLREKRTSHDCAAIGTAQYPVKTQRVTINGVEFYSGETGVAAAGSSLGGTAYRTFHGGVCFEIAAQTAWSDAWEPDDGPQLSATGEERIESILSAMFHTFRFVGPVRDGSAWRQYSDSSCASMFEYPETSEVRVDVLFSAPRMASAGVTCSESFADGELRYTISAKADLRSRDAADVWLQTSGYPGLESATVLSESKNCIVYRAGPYYYIYVQSESTAYLLFVSDATHPVISPDGNPIFSHLLDSFKVY